MRTVVKVLVTNASCSICHSSVDYIEKVNDYTTFDNLSLNYSSRANFIFRAPILADTISISHRSSTDQALPEVIGRKIDLKYINDTYAKDKLYFNMISSLQELTHLTFNYCRIFLEEDYPELYMPKLQSLTIEHSTFCFPQQDTKRFVEKLKVPNLTSLTLVGLSLKSIPHIDAPYLTSFSFNSNRIDDTEFNANTFMIKYPKLQDVSFDRCQFTTFESVKPLIGKYDRLVLNNNPFQELLLLNGAGDNVVMLDENLIYETERAKYCQTINQFGRDDISVYKNLRTLLVQSPVIPLSCLPHRVKKPNITLGEDNLLFWNTLYSKNKTAYKKQGKLSIDSLLFCNSIFDSVD